MLPFSQPDCTTYHILLPAGAGRIPQMNYFGKDSIARMVLYEMGLFFETRKVVCDNKSAMFLRV